MPRPGFQVPDFTLRYGLGRTLHLQTGWMLLVGTAFVFMPTHRFATPSWQFIVAFPGGDNVVGGLYITIGLAMWAALSAGMQKFTSVAVGLAGLANWTLGIFLLAGATNGQTGGIGFAMALYPGGHMLLISTMLWRRFARASE